LPGSADDAYVISNDVSPLEERHRCDHSPAESSPVINFECGKPENTLRSTNISDYSVQPSMLDCVRIVSPKERQLYRLLDKPVSLEGTLPHHKECSFASKAMKFSDDNLDLAFFNRLGLSVSSLKGKKDCRYNQDDFILMLEGDKILLGVFDGHGADGHRVSSIARSKLPEFILNHDEFDINIVKSFEDGFEELNKLLTKQIKTEGNQVGFSYSGTTATVAIIKDDKITIGNVGDSRAVLAKRSQGGYEAIRLTYDHKPEIPHELYRIQNKGGEVIIKDNKYRVYGKNKKIPGLNMSRALGDKFAQSIGVIAEPSIFMQTVQEEDEYLIICSDGVWEHIEDSEAVDLVRKSGANIKKATEDLSKLACSRWKAKGKRCDDITVMICYLKGSYLRYMKNRVQ
jgi:serine/threonine protein phosphatase PrpC